MMVFIYLASIILANMSVTIFGPSSTIINAFLFIGLDLTARDKLHERWKGKIVRNMTALILLGAAITWALNKDAGPVALASIISFMLANLVDAAVYQVTGRKSRGVRVNGSNAAAALIDSIAFPTIAFGALMPGVIIGQFVAKVIGGFVWYKILESDTTKAP